MASSLFLRAKVVRRLPRRSDIAMPCWCSLSASPAGGRFASAGEKSHLFLRYCLPANSRCGHSASAGENHPPSLATAYRPTIQASTSAGEIPHLFPRYCPFLDVLGRALLRSHSLFQIWKTNKKDTACGPCLFTSGINCLIYRSGARGRDGRCPCGGRLLRR